MRCRTKDTLESLHVNLKSDTRSQMLGDKSVEYNEDKIGILSCQFMNDLMTFIPLYNEEFLIYLYPT